MSEKEVRLIDANNLSEFFKTEAGWWDGRDQYEVLWAIENKAPTIDPESLRPHGKWERVVGDIHRSGYAVWCTNCGKYHFVHYRGSLGGLYAHDELFREPPDCPNCGAKMEDKQ